MLVRRLDDVQPAQIAPKDRWRTRRESLRSSGAFGAVALLGFLAESAGAEAVKLRQRRQALAARSV